MLYLYCSQHFGTFLRCIFCFVFASMALVVSPRAASPRIRIDSDLEVSAIQTLLQEWLASRNTRDLLSLLKPLASTNWKHSPVLSMICSYMDLFRLVMKYSSVCKLPHKGLETACLGEHFEGESAILFGPRDWTPPMAAAACSFRIRVLLSKFRDIISEDHWRVAFAKVFDRS